MIKISSCWSILTVTVGIEVSSGQTLVGDQLSLEVMTGCPLLDKADHQDSCNVAH